MVISSTFLKHNNMVKMDIVVSLFSNIKAVNYPSHVSLMELLGKIGDCDRSIKRLVDVVLKEKDKYVAVLEKISKDHDYDIMAFCITDVINSNSYLLYNNNK